jgi:hypothetical protein
MQHYTYGIVGFGISGQLLVCELLKRNVSPKNIVIFDKTFLGGALATEYGSVMSNTQWWKTKKALKAYEPYSTPILADLDTKLQETQCTPVRQIATACYKVAMEAAKGVEKKTTTVNTLESSSSGWTIHHTFGKVTVNTLFLCPGGYPKSLPIDLPQIPLPIALHQQKLSNLVSNDDKVMVFGASHSGVICLDHLHRLGIPAVAVYHHTVPFKFADEGAYDGLKEESAVIAKRILAGEFTNTTLVSWEDPLALHKQLSSATKCICAVGFQGATTFGADFSVYSETTGEIQPNLYGFGLAYPGVTQLDGKRYVDVSVLSFQEQLTKCLPEVLRKNTSSS